MKKKLLLIWVLIFYSFAFNAKAEIEHCFIVKGKDGFIIKDGKDCNTRYSPASTFKIVLALIGYEAGILKDENYPIWKPSEPITFLENYWSGEKTPSNWMRFSVVWYSKILTTKLGMDKFKMFIEKLNYGNKDLSGNFGKNDGLTQAWLGSSLLISPLEQIDLIEKLAKNDLPLSIETQIKAKNLIRLFEESMLTNGWTIYGKTGFCFNDKTRKKEGYFVGFAEKDNEIISFVMHLNGDKDSKVSGILAKKMTLDRLDKECLLK